MRHLVQSGVNTRTGGAAPRAYAASTDTPRSSLVGFTLLALVIIQLVSGVFITARIFESPEVQNLAGLLHKVLPLFFVGV